MKRAKYAMMHQKVEMQYMAELIRAQLDARTPDAVPEEIEVERLMEYAADAQMDYLILGSLIKLPLNNQLKERIQNRLIISTMRTLAQIAAIKELSRSLEKGGVRFQVLKGAILKQIYPTPEMREMSDIDIMIYDKTLDQANDIILSLGYTETEAVKHHIIYRKKPFIILEAHWALYDKNLDVNQYTYFCENFRAVCATDKLYTYIFSTEDFYVYMIAHMAKHFYENGCGIRNLLDIYIYMQKYEKEMDIEKIRVELTRCGLHDFENHVRELAIIWMEGKESSDYYNFLFEYMLKCGIYGKGENGIWGQLAKGNTTEKYARIRFYFPDAKYMKEQYVWLQKFPWLLPLAWMVRAACSTNKNALERGIALAHTDSEQIEKIVQLYKTLKLDFRK